MATFGGFFHIMDVSEHLELGKLANSVLDMRDNVYHVDFHSQK